MLLKCSYKILTILTQKMFKQWLRRGIEIEVKVIYQAFKRKNKYIKYIV